MVNIALISTLGIVRRAMACLLLQEPDILTVQEFNSAQATENVLKSEDFDLCILDISYQLDECINFIKTYSNQYLILTCGHQDSLPLIKQILDCGAKGFISKSSPAQELTFAIRTILDGGQYINQKLAIRFASFSQTDDPLTYLTNRERQVSEMITQGYSVKLIAQHLKLSPKTIHVHRANALGKLQVQNNVQLAKFFDQKSEIHAFLSV